MTRLRALLFNAAFLVWTVGLGIVGIGVRTAYRNRALDLARLWVVGTIALLRVVGGIPILVSGRDRLGDGAGLLVAAEHRAAIDSLVWLALVRRPSYVMKQELRRLPLVGPLLEPAGMIPIDRRGGATALRAMLRGGREALASGRTLIIFPEGTRASRTGEVPLQAGIAALTARGMVPVLPAATDSGEAWGSGFLLRVRGRPGVARPIRILIGERLGEQARSDPRLAIALAWRHADEAILREEGSWTRL